MKIDVCVIGAGLAGIVCALQLQKKGLKVVVLDKSRGLGGRMATRRLDNTQVNHGLPYLEIQGDLTRELVNYLLPSKVLQPLEGAFFAFDSVKQEFQPLLVVERYIAESGMTSIAKYLSKGLTIHTNCLVTKVEINKQMWQVTSENLIVEADALVMAMPAPQIVPIIEGVADFDSLEKLRRIEYEPDITVMAGYDNFPVSLAWRFLEVAGDANLSKLSWQKVTGAETVFVLHSTPELAKAHFDLDFTAAGEGLLHSTSQLLSLPLAAPSWFKVHRWRYAFPKIVLDSPYLEVSTPLPLICCGDWTGHNLLESALSSGTSSAERLLN